MNHLRTARAGDGCRLAGRFAPGVAMRVELTAFVFSERSRHRHRHGGGTRRAVGVIDRISMKASVRPQPGHYCPVHPRRLRIGTLSNS